MKPWFAKWNRATPAANATMWMASPGAAMKAGPARVTTVNQEIRRYVEIFFGGLCIFLFLLSLANAWSGATTWRTPLFIFIFISVNLALFHLALRASNPLPIIVLQTISGWVLCPAIYLATDGASAPWWPGYAVMGLSAAVFWGLA